MKNKGNFMIGKMKKEKCASEKASRFLRGRRPSKIRQRSYFFVPENGAFGDRDVSSVF